MDKLGGAVGTTTTTVFTSHQEIQQQKRALISSSAAADGAGPAVEEPDIDAGQAAEQGIERMPVTLTVNGQIRTMLVGPRIDAA
jgi:hypothetical protein